MRVIAATALIGASVALQLDTAEEGACAGKKQYFGQLATIHSEDELALAEHVVGKYRWIGFWIGLTDKKKEGTFKWTDGSALKFENWRRAEPNNWRAWGGGEDCVVSGNDGTWNDVFCWKNFRPLCMKVKK